MYDDGFLCFWSFIMTCILCQFLARINQMKQFVITLEQVQIIEEQAQRETVPTLSSIWIWIYQLRSILEPYLDDEIDIQAWKKVVAQEISHRFEWIYDDHTVLIAVALDPRIRSCAVQLLPPSRVMSVAEFWNNVENAMIDLCFVAFFLDFLCHERLDSQPTQVHVISQTQLASADADANGQLKRKRV